MASNPKFSSQELHDPAKLLSFLTPATAIDTAAVVVAISLLASYLLADYTWNRADPYQYILFEKPQLQDGGSRLASQTTRNISERLEELVSLPLWADGRHVTQTNRPSRGKM